MLVGPALTTSVGVPAPPAGFLRVVFLDVGQGDSTVVLLPGTRTLLVDAGGLPGASLDIGDRVVAPALRAFSVRSIDTLVLTHGDPDHIGGAPAILRRFSPREIWEGVPVPPHVALRDLATAATASGAAWRSVQSGDRETSGGVEIRVLHPPPADWERQRVRNEDSVVIELRLGSVSIVLPGDIGREAEQILTPRLATAPITIVKARTMAARPQQRTFMLPPIHQPSSSARAATIARSPGACGRGALPEREVTRVQDGRGRGDRAGYGWSGDDDHDVGVGEGGDVEAVSVLSTTATCRTACGEEVATAGQVRRSEDPKEKKC
jgi:hypothetical protein